MAKYPGTLLPRLTDPKDSRESRKAVLDLLKKINDTNTTFDTNAQNLQEQIDALILGLYNLGISASVSNNAMTINLTQSDGESDPTQTNPVGVRFRSAFPTVGSSLRADCSSALSITVSSGSTLGSSSTYSNRIYVYAILANGAIELAVSGSPYNDGEIVSTTAEGGAGAADSKFVMYSRTARANVPCRLIGRVTSTQATAGTWATAPSRIEIMPFDIVERGANANGNYEQHPDGVMMQWGAVVSSNISSSTSNYFGSTSGTSYFASVTATWPLVFQNAPSVAGMCQSPADTTTQIRTAATTIGVEFRLVNGSSVGAGTVRWYAIESWR